MALHGFGGDRHSSVIKRLAERCGNVLTFDLPAHGESNAPDRALTAENCLSDFETVLGHLRKMYPERQIRFFATSFGGYILLNALHLIRESEKIVLRAPAVKMAETYRDVIAKLPENEIFEREYVICGFERKIKVSSSFYRSLLSKDVMASPDRKMLLIHGDKDEVVLPKDICEFCKLHPSVTSQVIEGADHRFKGAGQVDELVELANNWFCLETIHKNT